MVAQPLPGSCQAQCPVVPTLLTAQPGSIPLQPPASRASPLPPLVSMTEQHSAGPVAFPQQRLSREAIEQLSGPSAGGMVQPGPPTPTLLVSPSPGPAPVTLEASSLQLWSGFLHLLPWVAWAARGDNQPVSMIGQN